MSVTWVAKAASVIPSLSTPDTDVHTCLHAHAYQQQRKYRSGLGFQCEPQAVSSASFWQRGMKEINVLASGRNITTVCLLQIFTLFAEIPAGTRAPIWTLLWVEPIEMTEKLCLRTLWFYLWHTTPPSTKESSGRQRDHSYPHITSPPKQTSTKPCKKLKRDTSVRRVCEQRLRGNAIGKLQARYWVTFEVKHLRWKRWNT